MSRRRIGGGGVAWWERDERRLEGDAPARASAHPPASHTHPTMLVAYRADRLIGGDNVAVTLAGSRRQCVGM